MQETWVRSLGQEDLLETKLAAHPSLASEMAWTEEPSGLLSMGSKRVEYGLVTKQQQQESYISLTGYH